MWYESVEVNNNNGQNERRPQRAWRMGLRVIYYIGQSKGSVL